MKHAYSEFCLNVFDKLQISLCQCQRAAFDGQTCLLCLGDCGSNLSLSSTHYNENIQKVASLADIDDEIFKFTTILLRTKSQLVKLGSMRISMESRP